MNAQEIFGSIGYKKDFRYGCMRFERDWNADIDYGLIEFDLDKKTVCASWFHEIKEVCMPELKAIVKQCEELGWL